MGHIRPARTDTRANVRAALRHLRIARDLLRKADCPRALEKTRAAIKSADGADRHASHRSMRTAL
jgi:hypothetical protein